MKINMKTPTLNHNIIQKAKPYCTKCLKKVLKLHKGIYCTVITSHIENVVTLIEMTHAQSENVSPVSMKNFRPVI